MLFLRLLYPTQVRQPQFPKGIIKCIKLFKKIKTAAVSHSILPTPGDESLVTDFVPVSPPRQLHPDTGQLVVKPDTAQSRPPRSSKVKDKKGQGDRVEGKAEKGVTEIGELAVFIALPLTHSVLFMYECMHVCVCVCACM